MKVILTEDVKSLGKKGEIVNVSDGYARNFILKKNKGVEANGKNLNDLTTIRLHSSSMKMRRNLARRSKQVRSKLRSRWEKAAKHSVPYLQKRSQKRLKSRWILRSTRRKYS